MTGEEKRIRWTAMAGLAANVHHAKHHRTVLAPDAMARLTPAYCEGLVSADGNVEALLEFRSGHGSCHPRQARGWWERGGAAFGGGVGVAEARLLPPLSLWQAAQPSSMTAALPAAGPHR